jgi:bacterioferritin-associated ferredoxin
MYACVCHAVTDNDVRDHVAAGACSAKQVRAACGMRPGCGSCVNRIRALIEEELAQEAAPAA